MKLTKKDYAEMVTEFMMNYHTFGLETISYKNRSKTELIESAERMYLAQLMVRYAEKVRPSLAEVFSGCAPIKEEIYSYLHDYAQALRGGASKLEAKRLAKARFQFRFGKTI